MATETENPAAPELIVFGGAFDPPHSAHVAAVAAALERFPEAQIWVLPAAAPAMAGGGAKEPGASFEHRLAMTKAAFESLGSRVWVLPLENELPKPNYTIQTLRTIASLAPGRRLGLLLGQDQAAAFPRWRAPEQILELASLVILGRKSPDGSATFGELKSGLGVLFSALPEANAKTLILVGLDVGPAASHIIRDKIAAADDLPAGWVPKNVHDYIRNHALYGATDRP